MDSFVAQKVSFIDHATKCFLPPNQCYRQILSKKVDFSGLLIITSITWDLQGTTGSDPGLLAQETTHMQNTFISALFGDQQDHTLTNYLQASVMMQTINNLATQCATLFSTPHVLGDWK